MPSIVTRHEVESILRRWQAGELTHQQVFVWANDRFASEQWGSEDEITNEVLAELDTLNMNLTTVDDIPHLLQVLALPNSQVESAIALQQAYASTIDIQARRVALATDTFYAPFCR